MRGCEDARADQQGSGNMSGLNYRQTSLPKYFAQILLGVFIVAVSAVPVAHGLAVSLEHVRFVGTNISTNY
jgi:hypothetical protein